MADQVADRGPHALAQRDFHLLVGFRYGCRRILQIVDLAEPMPRLRENGFNRQHQATLLIVHGRLDWEL